jgi:putative sterol carrier protein
MADAAVVKMIFDGMAGSFQPDKAAGVNTVIQYDITGEGGGKWNVVIADGKCTVSEGAHDAPKLTLTIGAQDWIDMIMGKLDGQQAFMTGKLKLKGDMAMAMKMGNFFAPPPQS